MHFIPKGKKGSIIILGADFTIDLAIESGGRLRMMLKSRSQNIIGDEPPKSKPLRNLFSWKLLLSLIRCKYIDKLPLNIITNAFDNRAQCNFKIFPVLKLKIDA